MIREFETSSANSKSTPSRTHYNWHRYYDPSIGRYISADPIGQAGGINVYNYAANSPLNYLDPDGLDVVNGTDGPLVVLPEADGAKPYFLPPGDTHEGPQDGFAIPGAESVFKTSDRIDARVAADGSVTTSVSPSGHSKGAVGFYSAIQAMTGGELDSDEIKKAGPKFQDALDQANDLSGKTGCACMQ